MSNKNARNIFENVKDALQALFAKERDGRILLNMA